MSLDGDNKWGGRYEEMLRIALHHYGSMLHDEAVAQNCESEIEAMMAFAFYACKVGSANNGMNLTWEPMRWQYPEKWNINECLKASQDKHKVYVFPQVSIDGYRVDFLCVFTHLFEPESRYRMLAVECDGHDFHEKTKQQAARDKARDRALLLSGIPSMRFAGSEIWKDAFACVRQVDEYFWEMIERQFDDRHRPRGNQ